MTRIVCLPGDGVGPEVLAEALRVLEALPLDVQVETRLFGGAARVPSCSVRSAARAGTEARYVRSKA